MKLLEVDTCCAGVDPKEEPLATLCHEASPIEVSITRVSKPACSLRRSVTSGKWDIVTCIIRSLVVLWCDYSICLSWWLSQRITQLDLHKTPYALFLHYSYRLHNGHAECVQAHPGSQAHDDFIHICLGNKARAKILAKSQHLPKQTQCYRFATSMTSGVSICARWPCMFIIQ